MAASAVCMVGEVRSLIFRETQVRLQKTILEPLGADVFMVMSLNWTQTNAHRKWPWAPLEMLARLTHNETAVRMLAAALNPLSLTVVNDDELLQSPMADEDVQHVVLQLRGASMLESCKQSLLDPSPLHRAAACGLAQVALALRFRVCLRQIREHEQGTLRRAYSWVIRCRPDIYLSCMLSLPSADMLRTITGQHQRSFIIYAWDLLAFMTREAAEVHLRQLALGPLSPLCTNATYARQWEFCNPCLASRLGLSTLRFANVSRFEVVRSCGLEHRSKSCQTSIAPPDVEAFPQEACMARPPVPWIPTVKLDPRVLRAQGHASSLGIPPGPSWHELCAASAHLQPLTRTVLAHSPQRVIAQSQTTRGGASRRVTSRGGGLPLTGRSRTDCAHGMPPVC